MLVEDAANPRSRQTERRQERETMQHFTQVIDGIDGSRAELVGYVIDNSLEMDPDRRRPAILIIPGGGYAIGSDRESEPVALQFLAAGYQAFVLKYSCAPSRYPVALLEMAEAMSMIRGHADEWHVDAGRVAAIGVFRPVVISPRT